MATVIFIKESKQTPSAMRGCIRYCVQEKKTVDENGMQYVSGVNCLGQHAYEEFMATKNLYGKACGTYFYQYVQSFAPGEIRSYEEAHRIGLEFAGKSFPGYEVLVATHLDAHDDSGVQRVHNHFIVNSVSFEDGRKIHFTPNTLQELRKISDDICRDHGLSVLPPSERRNGQGIGTREYRATMRGEGWKFGLINDIDTAMTQAGDRREFCDILASVGYSVTWTEERKYITFTCPNGRKVRDNKLHDNKYTKENLEYEFRIRKQITEHAGSQPDGQTESGIQNGSQDNRGNTVSADCLCDSEGGLERLSGMDETGSDLSAHAVSADCGADDIKWNNTRHKRTDPRTYHRENFTCGAYSKFGERACTSHYIQIKILNQLVLADVRSKMSLVLADEKRAREEFLSRNEQQNTAEANADRKKLTQSTRRLAELDKLIGSVYEDKVLGKIPEEVCIHLLEKYQSEKKSLAETVTALEQKAQTVRDDAANADEFIRRLKAYMEIPELTREMCLELIEFITVDECPGKYSKAPREIHIYYKLIDKKSSAEQIAAWGANGNEKV